MYTFHLKNNIFRRCIAVCSALLITSGIFLFASISVFVEENTQTSPYVVQRGTICTSFPPDFSAMETAGGKSIILIGIRSKIHLSSAADRRLSYRRAQNRRQQMIRFLRKQCNWLRFCICKHLPQSHRSRQHYSLWNPLTRISKDWSTGLRHWTA